MVGFRVKQAECISRLTERWKTSSKASRGMERGRPSRKHVVAGFSLRSISKRTRAKARDYVLALMLMQQPLTTLIGIDQNLGVKVDPHITFRNEFGQTVQLGEYFGSRPIILVPVYYEC